MKVVIAVILLSAVLSTITSKKLVFIECITRHGVRYPAFPNPYDFSNISEIQHSKSELTNQGRHMHFVLGRLLYKKYWNELFVNNGQGKFNNSLIYAKSTNTNRTIESLQNLLLGFFAELQNDQIHFADSAEINPPFKSSAQDELEEQWNQFWLKQRTIPIHVEKGAEGDPGIANSFNEGDFLVKQEYNLCPNQVSWEQENLNSLIVRKIMNSAGMQKAIQRLRPHFKDFPLDFENLYKIVDNYNCLKAMGKSYLPVFQEEEIQSYLCKAVNTKNSHEQLGFT